VIEGDAKGIMAFILIVDDESRMRHILKIMLSLEGHNVEEAQDGETALAMVREKAYDLVVSDIRMPRMDGFALLDHIQAMECPCPVIIITAYASILFLNGGMCSGKTSIL